MFAAARAALPVDASSTSPLQLGTDDRVTTLLSFPGFVSPRADGSSPIPGLSFDERLGMYRLWNRGVTVLPTYPAILVPDEGRSQLELRTRVIGPREYEVDALGRFRFVPADRDAHAED